MPFTSYSFVVYAVDGSGNRSSDSNLVNANTPGETTCIELLSLTLILALTVMACAQGRSGSVSQQQFDIIIRGGTVYDGTGRAPVKADVGIKADRIAASWKSESCYRADDH